MMTLLAILIAVVMMGGISYTVVAAIRGNLIAQLSCYCGNLDGMFDILGKCLSVIGEAFSQS